MAKVEAGTPAADQAPAEAASGGQRPLLWVAAAAVVVVAMAVGVTTLGHTGDGAVGVLAAALRYLRYLGTLAAVGSLVFLLLVCPKSLSIDRREVRLAASAVGLGLLATLLAIPAHAVYLTGDLAASADAGTLAAVARSGFGMSAAVGLAGLALVGLSLRRMGAPLSVGAGAGGAVLALGAFLLTGHTVTAEPRALSLGADLAHTAAAAVWLGGLLQLPLALGTRRAADDAEGAARLVARFSAAATVALVAVVTAGVGLAWVQVRTVEALATPYGATLAVKVAVVAGVAGLAAYNNRRLVPAIRDGRRSPWGTLGRVVRLEAAGLAVVLAATAVLVNVVPARIEAGIGAQETRIAQIGADHSATVVVDPARPGSNELHVYIEHDRGLLDDPVEDVSIAFVPPGADEPAATVSPARVSPGHWLHLGSELDARGQWRLEISGEIGGDPQTATVEVPITTAEDWVE